MHLKVPSTVRILKLGNAKLMFEDGYCLLCTIQTPHHHTHANTNIKKTIKRKKI